MISYDTYQNKIKRVAAVKNFIVRFRALFISLFAAIIALILTFIFIKGMITQDIVLPDKIIYGDNYSNEIQAPKALFGSAQYQFKRVKGEKSVKSSVKRAVTDEAEKEEEWTYDVPTLAGKYLVRTVSKKTFGKSYGTPKEFEIESCPVEFKIESDSIVYGEMPDKYTFELKNGDRLVTEGVKFVYSELDINDICANAKSFVILNKTDEDVTFCYDISVTVDPEEVTILPRDINLTLEQLTIEYNGAAVDYDGALTAESVGSLMGDDVQFSTNVYDGAGNVVEGTPVNAGIYTVEIVPDKTAVYNGEVDVTGYYNIVYSTATIEIKKRPVTVTTASETKEYDGAALVNDNIGFIGLVEEHTHNSQYIGQTAINAGAYENLYDCTFFDADGTDVTANYEIEYVYGTLEISRRAITVVTADRLKIYDGSPLSESDFNNSYTLEKDGSEVVLVDGHTQELVFSNEISFVAQSYTPNEITIEIYGADGNPVNDNYDITYNYGTLEIKHREISVTSVDETFIYNGQEQSAAEIADIAWTDGLEGAPLADGEEIVVVSGSCVTYYSGETVANDIECIIMSGTEDVTENYKITYISGSLKIEQRQLTVTTASLAWDYDGGYHYGDEEQNTENGRAVFDGLVDGEFAEAFNVAKIINNRDNKENNNTTEYKFYTDSTKDIETTGCYKIDYVNGTLTVNRAKLTVTTATLSWVYDGDYHSGSELPKPETETDKAAVFEGLADGEFAEPFNVKTVINYSEDIVKNTTEYRFYTDETKETETTDNYDVTYINGILTVNKRYIVVQTASAEKEYDGIALTCAEGTVAMPVVNGNSASYELVNTHSLEIVEVIGKITDVKYNDNGEIVGESNVILYKVVDENGDDAVNDNYDIGYKYGTLKITPRNIQITTDSGRWVYDGDEHFAEGYDKEKEFHLTDGVPDEEPALVSDKHELSLVADSVNKVKNYTFEKVKNKVKYTVTGEEGVAGNYNITYIEGDLEITKRPITVTTGSAEKVYDGKGLWCREIVSIVGGKVGEIELKDALVKSHKVTAKQYSEIFNVAWDGENVKSIENDVYCKVVDENYDDAVNINYEITYVWGTLKITPRPIDIITDSAEKIYDGKPLSCTEPLSVEGVDLEWALVDGHSLDVKLPTFITDVQWENNEIITVKNVVYYGVIDDDGKDVTKNYSISYSDYGTLKVLPRPIEIVTGGTSKIYDGTALECASFASENANDENTRGLVFGERVILDEEKGVASITRIETDEGGTVDSKENERYYKIFGADGKDISCNYDITYIYGTLKILPRPIEIVTSGASKIYDGTELKCASYATENANDENTRGLVEGESVALDEEQYIASITRIEKDENGAVVDSKENERYYKIFGADGKDISCNYDIIYIYGTLKILPRPIEIVTGGASKIYDGTELKCASFASENANDENTRGLVEGESVALDEEQYIASITRIEKDENGAVVDGKENERYYKIYGADGTDITCNYDIEYVYGTLKILPRPIVVTTADDSQVYDGTVLRHPKEWKIEGGLYNEEKLEIGLVSEEHVLTVKKDEDGKLIQTEIVDVQYDKSGSVTGVENRVEYEVIDGEGNFITLNYAISYEYGTLKITPRPIKITTGSASKIYDGTALTHYEKGWSVEGVELEWGLVDGHELVAKRFESLTDVKWEDGVVSTIDNEVEYEVFSGSKKVSGNYDVKEYVYGTLKITPRRISIVTDDGEFEYDGTPKFEEGKTVTYLGNDGGVALVLDHHLEVVSKTTRIDAGSEPNIVTYVVVDETVTKNYDITYPEYGTLTVTLREIKIVLKTEKQSYVYGEQPIKFTYDFADDNRLVNGATLEITAKYQLNGKDVTPKDVGTYKAVFDTVVIKGDDDANYSVTAVNDTSFSITEKVITITLKEQSGKPYDGEEFRFPKDGYTFAEGSELAYDDKNLEIAVKYLLNGKSAPPVDAGEYEVSIDSDSCRVNGEANKNYTVSCNDKLTINITKLKISFVLNDLTAVYNGEAYGFEFTEAIDKVNTLVKNDKLSTAAFKLDGDATEAKDVNVYSYTVQSFKIVHGDGSDSDNYEIDGCQTSGELSITERHIEVSVWFNDIEGYSSSREYTGKEIDVVDIFKSEQQPKGPFKSNLNNSTEFGIYGEDLKVIEAEFSFTQGGKKASLQNYGEYQVNVKLVGDVLNNYNISYKSGNFAITERQIIVTATSEKTLFEYNGKTFGEQVALSQLSFVTRHRFSEEAGFNPETDADNYDVVYCLYKRTDTAYKNNLINEVLQAGKYVLRAELTFNPDNPDKPNKYQIKYADFPITVNKRKIYVQVTDSRELLYNGEKVTDSTNYKTYYADGNWIANSGFVNNDADGIGGITYRYYNKTTDEYSSVAKDAGDYLVKITSFTTKSGFIDIANNYQILDLASAGSDAPECGKLAIKPATIVVVPVAPEAQEFDGTNLTIELPANYYQIRYVEGIGSGNDVALYGDDGLSINADTHLDVRNASSARVRIASVAFSNTLASNYNVIYTYGRESALLATLELKSSDFSVKLSYIQKEITVKQPAVPSGYEKIQVGTIVNTQVFINALGVPEIIKGELLSGSISVSSVSVNASKPKVITNWLKRFTVVDSEGNNVTNGYKITVDTSDESTYIEVVKKDIIVYVHCNSASDFDNGVTGYEAEAGALIFGETLEVRAENGELVYSMKRNTKEYNTYYSVEFVYLGTENNLREAEYASWI